MSRPHKILETKKIDGEKTIALIEWQMIGGGIEYSTHVIWTGCEGRHHGRYHNALKDAKSDFEIRE